MSAIEHASLITSIYDARSRVAVLKNMADNAGSLTLAAKLAAAMDSLTDSIQQMETTDDQKIPDSNSKHE